MALWNDVGIGLYFKSHHKVHKGNQGSTKNFYLRVPLCLCVFFLK